MRQIVNALFIRNGTILLARRSPHRAAYPNLWSFPGGHVENEETLDAALIGAPREEIGVTPTRFHRIGIINDPHAGSADNAWREIPDRRDCGTAAEGFARAMSVVLLSILSEGIMGLHWALSQVSQVSQVSQAVPLPVSGEVGQGGTRAAEGARLSPDR